MQQRYPRLSADDSRTEATTESEVTAGVINPDHKRENRLLRLCLELRPGESRLDSIRRTLSPELDWEHIFQFAERQGLVPLLYHQFNRFHFDSIPAEYQKRFKNGYQANVARTLILSDELLALTEELRSQGIDSLPYKGPLLGAIAFGDPALRCFIDLDIIVRPRDVSKAIQILQARGYQLARNIDARQTQMLLASQHNIQFERDDGHLIVELHWRVAADLFASALNPEYLWDNLELVILNRVQLNSLPFEELLLALCIHGTRHMWDRLSQICDIAALICTDRKIDWQRLMAVAKEADVERMLLLGLCLADELTENALPANIRESITSDRAIRRLADRIFARLFSDNSPIRLGPREVLQDNLLVRKSLSARIRYCLFALSPADADFETVALSRYLNFAYYGLRPFRMMVSALRREKRRSQPSVR